MHDTQLRSDERRRHPRSRILCPARINIVRPDLLMHCVVIDWSRGGASIQFEDPSLCPDSFVLIGADDWFEDCEVVWRQDDKIGARFPRVIDEGVNPAVLWPETQRQAQATAKTEMQIQFLLRGFLDAVASASLNAYRGLRPAK